MIRLRICPSTSTRHLFKSYNLGHNCLTLFSPLSMLNHVALLKPPLPQLNVELVSWYITKSCFGVVHNIELGGWGDSFLSTFNNFVTLAGISGMVSRVLSKPVRGLRRRLQLVQKLLRQLSHCPPPPTNHVGQTIQRYIVRSIFFSTLCRGGNVITEIERNMTHYFCTRLWVSLGLV